MLGCWIKKTKRINAKEGKSDFNVKDAKESKGSEELDGFLFESLMPSFSSITLRFILLFLTFLAVIILMRQGLDQVADYWLRSG